MTVFYNLNYFKKIKEYAIAEYGYKRPFTIRFEEFISSLIRLDHRKMPNDSLRVFNYMYEWAMIDSTPFTVDHFRQLNKLINKIIDALAGIKPTYHDRIIKYKLELDETGDCDMKQMHSNTHNLFSDILLTSEYCSLKSTSKQVKFDDVQKNEDSLNERTSSKLKQTSKNIFARKIPRDKSAELSPGNLDKEKLLNDESLNDTSFESNKSRTPRTYQNETAEMSHYSDLNAESVKPFDTNHEHIPLVTTSSKKSAHHSKKKSNQSDVTLIPTIVTATSSGFITSATKPVTK